MSKEINMLIKPSLSLCMIVKNERENLPKCLAKVKPYVDEIIVVDTGSEDGTPEIASEYGAKVNYFEWCNDFAAARNYAISQASSDWILMLDADEELVVESTDFLTQISAYPDIIAYNLTYIEVDDQPDSTPSYRTSLFRNIAELRYIEPFHEYLKFNNKSNRYYFGYLEGVKILHYGFVKAHLQQKNLSRNIPMLESIREEKGLSLRLLSTLSGMYADTGQLEKAEEYSAEVFEQLLPNLLDGKPPEEFVFVPDILFVLGVQSLSQQDYETATLICQRGLEWCPNFPPLSYLTGATVRGLGFPLGATAYFENCLKLAREGSYYKQEPFKLCYMTTYPAYDLGCIWLELNRTQQALAAFELALSFDPNFTQAQEKLEKIKLNLYK